MAVNFKMKGTTVSAVFGYLDIPLDKQQKFTQFGLKMELLGDAIFVSSPAHGSQTKISTTATAISSLKNGKLGSVTSGYLKKALLQVIDALPSHPVDWDGKLVGSDNVTATKEEVKTAKDILQATPVHTGEIKMFPMTQLNSAPMSQLRDATMMYEPVKGTGANSRYWVIAISDNIKVAARWQQQTMSIRVEGKGVGSMGHILSKLGFNNVKQDYASVHLQVGADNLLANRTIGAVVSSLSEYTAIKSPVPNAQVVRSK